MSSTVVTCYYKIKSKHSFEEYDNWITNFLTNVNCNLVIFTSPDLKDYLMEKRQGNVEKTFIICKELYQLEIAVKYLHKWDYQYSIDKLLYCGRTKECYILWNSKLWFLKNAIDINPFDSDKFVWTDIGCLREPNNIRFLKNYPIYDLISNDKLDIALIAPVNDKTKNYFLDEVHFSGAMFGSHKDVIINIYNIFYQRFDEFINKEYFIGCDQQTIASIYNTNSELFNIIIPNHYIEILSEKFIDDESKFIFEDQPYFFLWFYLTYNVKSNIFVNN